MATSSERSPPPFPDSEDQDVLDSGDVGGRGSDEDDGDDLFMSVSNASLGEIDVTLPSGTQPGDDILTPLSDIVTSDPISSQSGSKTASEPSDEFVDLTNNMLSPGDSVGSGSVATDEEEAACEIPLNDDFVDILGSETEAQQQEVPGRDVEAMAGESELILDLAGEAKQEVEETAPLLDISGNSSANSASQPPGKIVDPLLDFLGDPMPAVGQKQSTPATADLFEDEGSDLFTEPQRTKPAKQPQKSLFAEPDDGLFAEPLGAKMPARDKPLTPKAVTGGDGKVDGPLLESSHSDIFTEEAVAKPPRNTSLVNTTNGVHVEENTDIFADATVELSLDSPRSERKKDATPAAKPSTSAASSVSTTASVAKPQVAAMEELEEEEEEDKFDIAISVTDPEKIGDGMNAYMAYKVCTQTTMSMFRNKNFTVRRRFSDFLGLYEKLSEKHGPNGLIVPPPPEKSILGMTKVKVGKEDSSSADFVERRRGALERYLQRVVTHPSLLQDPDVREFLERDELPRAVSTQALSGAGFLKMINKATDAVSKMTIKMNESDVWFEEKLQEVESADQQFRKLHALMESLVIHRKELSTNTASFAKSTAMLGSAEDNTALSRALSQLAEVEDKMEQLHLDQAANDTFCFAELIADFIRLLGAVRGSFDHRMKAWQRWQDAQTMLQKKRESEAKLQWANKPDKLQLAKEEISEWEAKVMQYEQDFDRVSATVRKEVVRFEKEKANNFKRQIIKYLESLLKSQQQLIKYWEAFLPEAKAIA
ncbi:sorting nexin-1a [Dunckerocampus dactyliophorus]|uniref:sorting nexin-1a n=1 Tax=Dunckerocampus dactyliophorus TaxID=161453 RepID=UPI00240699EC|nr:sorting nexin-1a [Dunckerocampus dactyliophorus]